MIHAFDPKQGLIFIDVAFTGPAVSRIARLALDTGATTTLVSKEVLNDLGFDLANEPDRVPIMTGSAVTTVARVVLTRITALGRSLCGLPVLAHSLPANAPIAGLLGLDLLRDSELTIDFKAGQIRLA